jgi:hypothetical protein
MRPRVVGPRAWPAAGAARAEAMPRAAGPGVPIAGAAEPRVAEAVACPVAGVGRVALGPTAAGALVGARPRVAEARAETRARFAEPVACPVAGVGRVALGPTAAGALVGARGPARPAEEREPLAGPLVRGSVRWSPEAETKPPPVPEQPRASPARLPGAVTPFPGPVVPPRPWRPLHRASQVGRQTSLTGRAGTRVAAPQRPLDSWRATAMPRRDRCFRPGTPSGRGACSRPDREPGCAAHRERRL